MLSSLPYLFIAGGNSCFSLLLTQQAHLLLNVGGQGVSLHLMGRTSVQPSVVDHDDSGGSSGGGGRGGGGRTPFVLSYDPVEASLLTVTAATALWTSIIVPSLWKGRLSEEKLVILMQFVITQVRHCPLSQCPPLNHPPLSCNNRYIPVSHL